MTESEKYKLRFTVMSSLWWRKHDAVPLQRYKRNFYRSPPLGALPMESGAVMKYTLCCPYLSQIAHSSRENADGDGKWDAV